MNKLLQHMIDLGDVDHKILPVLQTFQPGGQKGNPLPIWAREIPRSTGDIASLPGVRIQVPVSKQELNENKKRIEAKKAADNARILADRRARIKASMDARSRPLSPQQIADETQAIGDKFRLFPDDPNSFFDDYLNPAVIIGDMASSIGRVPLNLQQGDYGQAAMAVGAPLAAGALAGVGASNSRQFVNNVVNPLSGVGEYLTTQTPLRNAYRINPWAFKPNPEAYYRMIGQEGYADALESGLLRSNPGKGGLQTQQFDDVYFSMKHPWDGRNYGYVTKSGEPIGGVGYKGPYMAELTGQELNHPISSFPRANMAQSKVPISLENPGLKLYKQDWLRGYKEVPKPTSSSKSEVVRGIINWWDEPGFRKRNPNFSVEAYLNSAGKFGKYTVDEIDESLMPFDITTLTRDQYKKFMSDQRLRRRRYIDPFEKFPTRKQTGGPIVDPRGQWAYPGQRTIVPTPTGRITMQGVPYPVYGQDETGFGQMMYPGGEYQFPGQMVDEIPMMQPGGTLPTYQTKGQVQPIYVTKPNDPRLRAYQDSLSLYNQTQHNLSHYLATHKGLDRKSLEKNRVQYTDTETLIAKTHPSYTNWHTFNASRPHEGFLLYKPLFGGYKNQNIDWKTRKIIPKILPTGRYLIRTDSYPVDLSTDVIPAYKKPVQPVIYRKPVPVTKVQPATTVATQVEPVVAPQPQPAVPQTPVYKMQGTTPVYGPNNSLIGMLGDNNQFYPDYNNTAARSAVNQADSDIIQNMKVLQEYLRSKGVDPKIIPIKKTGGQHGGLDRWFAEKWVDVKTGKPCGRQEGENRAYPACRPSRRVSSKTPKTSSEMSPAEKAKFKRSKTSSERINYNHKRN